MASDKSKKGLGRGMDALFPDRVGSFEDKEVQNLPLTRVEPRQDQPRQSFDEATLSELAESIRTYGIIQPITVRKLDSGYYQIIAGERRWRAARMAELSEVPVRVIEADDRRAMELALVENLQREDLNPIEEARGYRTLMEEYGMTQEQAAESVGKSRPAIANSLRLLTLGAEVIKLVEDGELTAGHARTLIPISDEQEQLNAAFQVLNGGLSVRQTEALVARIQRGGEDSVTSGGEPGEGLNVDYIEEVRLSLEKALGRRVKITEGRYRGKVEIEFYDNDDRESLFEFLLSAGEDR